MRKSSQALLLGTIFGIAGFGLIVLGWTLDLSLLLFGMVGGLFVLVAAIALFFASRIRAQERFVYGESAPPSEWMAGWDRLAAEVQQAFAGSPYFVEYRPGGIRVAAHLADARFLTFGGLRRVQSVHTVDVVPVQPGVVARIDSVRDVEWTLGHDQSLHPRFTGRMTIQGGRVWQFRMHKEVGFDAEGFGTKVDYTFSTNEISEPLASAITAAGMRDALPASAKIALVMGIGAGGTGFLVGIGFAIAAALGVFG